MKQVVLVVSAIIIVLLLVLATLVVKERGTLWFKNGLSQSLISLYIAECSEQEHLYSKHTHSIVNKYLVYRMELSVWMNHTQRTNNTLIIVMRSTELSRVDLQTETPHFCLTSRYHVHFWSNFKTLLVAKVTSRPSQIHCRLSSLHEKSPRYDKGCSPSSWNT